MVAAGGADDAVFRIQKGVGALNQIAAAVVLLRGEVAEGFCFLRVQIADGDAAEQRNDRVAVAVKVNGGRGVRVGRLVGDVDLRVNGQRQNFIRRIGVVAVVVNVGVALGHVGVFLDLLGLQRLDGQRLCAAAGGRSREQCRRQRCAERGTQHGVCFHQIDPPHQWLLESNEHGAMDVRPSSQTRSPRRRPSSVTGSSRK